ncbi:uncharacterized protein EDB91DRAFT_632480 [Suillus paluster]|uniref:uncharacterized protein n=1 Tax=Suillus paluster TaxID=48578 RepID=UPI001B86DF6B|nr:uncharacterized protein EDB91DRAFT_632480 [Suillus paluster]KAG1733607.1 hypothetical protein EDB91DRAFT_632480 [Suillus paluster]
MATKSKIFDVSSPPSYDAISRSVGEDSVECNRSFFSSFCNRIRNVAPQPYLASLNLLSPVLILPLPLSLQSSTPALLLSQQHSSPTSSKNPISGVTALYRAIVNNRRKALLEFIKHLSELSLVCSLDLRVARMTASNQTLYTQLNLGYSLYPEDESLRLLLGCPPDEVRVHERNGLSDNHFVACFRFRMFQKRLRQAAMVQIDHYRFQNVIIYKQPKLGTCRTANTNYSVVFLL